MPAPPATTVARATAPDEAKTDSARPAAAKLDSAEVRSFEKSLRELLLKNLPDPIVKSDRGWGHQKEAVVRTNFLRDGPRLRTERVMGMKNDGVWRRVSIRAANPEQTLALGITEAAFPDAGRTTFTAMIGVDCDLKFEQQIWRSGRRFYSGETRGRCHAAVLLKCEVTSRTETKPNSFIPDLIFRVKVTEAKLFYEKLVIEHTAGLGGDAAKLLGDIFLDTVKQARPDLERELLNKANTAIVKAADTKELRISLDAFLKGGPTIAKGK
jgi:hypothetical protein